MTLFVERNNDPTQHEKDVTTAGTAEPLRATSCVVKRLCIQCKKTNTMDIYKGTSSVSSSAYQEVMPAYGLFREMFNVDLADVYIDADVDGEGVVYWYEIV